MDKRQVDEQLLRKLFNMSRFYSAYGKALNEAFFSDDIEKAKKVKLENK